jgi:hypothetical protein
MTVEEAFERARSLGWRFNGTEVEIACPQCVAKQVEFVRWKLVDVLGMRFLVLGPTLVRITREMLDELAQTAVDATYQGELGLRRPDPQDTRQ